MERKKSSGEGFNSPTNTNPDLLVNDADDLASEKQGNEITLDVRMTKMRGTSLIAKILTVEAPGS